MEAYPPNKSHRLATLRLHKWSAGVTAMLLSTALILSACGGSDAPAAETEAEATTAAPAATEAAEIPEATEVVETETGLITETEVLTETEVTTDVDVTEVTTETIVMTDTVEGGGEESDVTTETEVMTETEELEESEGVDDSEAMTDTEGVGDSEAMTETSSPETDLDAATFGVSGIDDQYVRASTLLDYDFDNLDGEVSGDLEDLLIDLSTGRVLFASIEYGGVLDLGDKDIVVPLNAFTVGPEGELILNIDEATLENYPDVGNDWPDLNDPVWDDDVATFWNDTGIDSGLNFEEPSTSVAWASELMGHNIADLGFGAGSVLDILVNLGTGNASYLIVDYGEGLDTDPYIIPLSAYDVAAWQDELVYRPDFTPDLLENAPRFDQEAYPEGTDIDSGFGDTFESWWNDMGFSNDLNNDGQVD
jgi:sporulation protein YlmC with PRC-barrel domain